MAGDSRDGRERDFEGNGMKSPGAPLKGTRPQEDMKHYFETPPRQNPIRGPIVGPNPRGPTVGLNDRAHRDRFDDDDDHSHYFRYKPYRFRCDRRKAEVENDRQMLKTWVNKNDFRFIDFNLPYENPYHRSFSRPLFAQARPNPEPRLPIYRYDLHLTSPMERYCDCIDCLYMARYRFSHRQPPHAHQYPRAHDLPPQHFPQRHPSHLEHPPQHYDRPLERFHPSQHLTPRPRLRPGYEEPPYEKTCPPECRFEMCRNADYFSLKLQVPYTHNGRAWMGDFFWYLGNWYLYDTDRDARFWANKTKTSSNGSPGSAPSGNQGDQSPTDTYQVEWVPKTWFK